MARSPTNSSGGGTVLAAPKRGQRRLAEAGDFRQQIHTLAAEGLTVLVSTHYMDEAERCQRLAFLSRGKLIGLGTVDEITSQFGQPTIEDVFIALQRKDEGVHA